MTKKWAHEKKEKDNQELKDLEVALETFLKDPKRAFPSSEEKEACFVIGKRRRMEVEE